MVNVEEAEWVKGLTEAAGTAFAQQLAEGQVKGPRLLLRFFAALTCSSVLLPADVLSLMEQMLEVAQSHAAAGKGTAHTACGNRADSTAVVLFPSLVASVPAVARVNSVVTEQLAGTPSAHAVMRNQLSLSSTYIIEQ
jgi:hypothetical protein